MEVSYPQAANLEQIRGAIEQKGWGEFQVQNFGTSRDVLIRLPIEKGHTSGQQAERVMQTLKAQDPAVELSAWSSSARRSARSSRTTARWRCCWSSSAS